MMSTAARPSEQNEQTTSAPPDSGSAAWPSAIAPTSNLQPPTSNLEPPTSNLQPPPPSNWNYDEAFARNLGLISAAEQQVLRNARVAIAGMGGVGGVHLTTLARLGIGRFTIADPDAFEVANFNRQAGATTATLGRGKAEVMAEQARLINPEVQVDVLHEAVDERNVDAFFREADIFIDGVDFFSIEARRLLFREARARGLWAITAGPIGFSAGWLAFDPRGMTFDRYFDLGDGQPRVDQLIAFAVGLTPRATHLGYLDLSHVSLKERRGPSASIACQLASGMAAAETVKILLNRGPTRAAPAFAQFDAYRGKLRKGRLLGGNRHPMQRLKRAVLRRKVAAMGGLEER